MPETQAMLDSEDTGRKKKNKKTKKTKKKIKIKK
jgi:hypothetical protein